MSLHSRKTCTAILWLGLLAMAAFWSCGFSSSREDAAEIMARYFAAIEKQDYPAAMVFYAATFFKETSRDAWEKELQGYNRQLGDLERFEAVRWNVKKHVGANSGTFVQVVYQTRYTRHSALEKFILKKTDADFRIIAHRIEVRGAPKKGRTEFI